MAIFKFLPLYKCIKCKVQPIFEGPELDPDDGNYCCEVYCPKCVNNGYLTQSKNRSYAIHGTIAYWNSKNT